MRTVSVVLASFNSTGYLQEQLDSIAGQTLRPTELIVGDDGSTDGTIALVDHFAEHAPFPVRVVAGPRKGHSANFLTAAEVATSSRIAWSDHDDVWLPEKLSRLAEAMDNTGASLAYHGAITVDAELKPVRTRYPAPVRAKTWEPMTRNIWQHTLWGNTMMIERSLLVGLDWRRRPCSQWDRRLMDHDGLSGMLASILGRIVQLPDKLLLYRQHGGNVVGAPAFGVRGQRWTPESHLESVLHKSRAVDDWLEYFVPLIPADRRLQAIKYLRDAKAAQERRGALLNSRNVAAATLGFMAHAATGAYRNSTPQGLGWRALARDGYYLTRRLQPHRGS